LCACDALMHEPDDASSGAWIHCTFPAFGSSSTPHDTRPWGGIGFWHLRGEPGGSQETHPISRGQRSASQSYCCAPAKQVIEALGMRRVEVPCDMFVVTHDMAILPHCDARTYIELSSQFFIWIKIVGS
ncbi:hypothetical protein BAE44_0008979, partial [Dichanthelium oligosanthes]